jgi:hypothetical protein
MPDSKGRQFRAALVVSYGFQEGVEKLAQYYAKEISLFQITPNGDFKIVSATHFHTVRPAGIKAKTPAAIITIGNTSPPQPRPHTQGAPAVLACLT